jgi:hypothetical protein
MEAKELRLGNYVLSSYNNDRTSIVTGICEAHIEVQFLERAENMVNGQICYPSKLNPIPLTEEWLSKIGFEYNYFEGYSYYLEIIKHKFGITYVIESNSFYCNLGIDIKYVHQVQNIYFSLTGKELTIKNK